MPEDIVLISGAEMHTIFVFFDTNNGLIIERTTELSEIDLCNINKFLRGMSGERNWVSIGYFEIFAEGRDCRENTLVRF